MYRASKSSLLWKITVFVVICCLYLPVQGKYGGGTGEPNDPYLIYTAEQMNAIGTDSNDWDKHFKLMADIDLGAYTGTSFNIIGTDYDNTFVGVFDGDGHTISQFSYTSAGANYIGVFGYVRGDNAEIKNLGLIDPNIDAEGGIYIGSLVGLFRDGTITNCYAEGGSVAGNSSVGGLMGENYYGIITNCYSTSSVMGDRVVGGLVGSNYRGAISNSYSTSGVSGTTYVGGLVGRNYKTIIGCYSTGSVSGNGYVGGLVGLNDSYSKITNCYSIASVSGDDNVGGLVGRNWGEITNCYSTGGVSGDVRVGGLVGYSYGYVVASFWDIETSGQAISDGGEGKTTAQMMMTSTFLLWGTCGQVWTINEGMDYPRLAWEQRPGEPIVSNITLKGNGIPNNPYLIYTAEELNVIGRLPCVWDKHFKLMANIDLSQYTGTEFNIIVRFTGTFDGDGHTISNFSYTPMYKQPIGLFGYVIGDIKNLGLIYPNLDAGSGSYVGSLVGRLDNGNITNCYVEGGIVSVSDSYYIGGLVGRNDYGTISECCSTGSVMGEHDVGGLVGYNDGTITNCYATTSISGYVNVGGLVGLAGYNVLGAINNSYSTGSVSGEHYVGGLMGSNYRGTITNCYSSGNVSGNFKVGGLVGTNSNGTVTTSFWDIETSGQTTSDGGTGLPTAEMQMMSTFTDAGWDFESGWWILEGAGYPRLWWEDKYGGGKGRPNDPYLIYTAEQMNTIGACKRDWDKHFKLMADIDLSGYAGTSFNIIGELYYDSGWVVNPFTGVFDGNGHILSNFTYTSTDTNPVGLFGYVDDPNAEIKNLGLISPNVNAGTGLDVGSLVGLLGLLSSGTITNCYVEGGSVSGDWRLGGLVGVNEFGTITDCYSTTGVSGDWYVGGLVGDNKGTITNCYSAGSVFGDWLVGGLVGDNYGTISNSCSNGSITGNGYIGGLVGKNGYYGTISNSYATGSVTGDVYVGGLVGRNWEGIITYCYSTDSVIGIEHVGGMVGEDYEGKGKVTDSFWDIETSGQTTSAGGTGKTTAEMQMMSTFTDAGWDFVGEIANGTEDIWWIIKGDYPHLWWEGMEVAMKLTPKTLNCQSKGGWVKAHFVLHEGITVEDVDSNILGRIDPLGIEADYMDVFVDEDGFVRVDMAFDRAVLCEGLTGAGSVEITVGGFLINGQYFYGTDTIKIK